jgi:uncharacterized membrane protein YgcG
MRRTVLSFVLATAVSAAAQAGYPVVRLGEVLALAREGVSSRTIVAFLETRPLGFVVATEEILQLRDAGAGEEVIRYLVERTAPRDAYGPDAYGSYADAPADDYRDAPYEDAEYEAAYVEYGPSYSIDASVIPYGAYVGDYYGGYYGGEYYGSRYYRGGYYRDGFGRWLARLFGFDRRGRYDVRDDRGWRYRYDRGSSYDHRDRYDHGYRFDRPYGGEYRYGRPPSGYRTSGSTFSRGYSVPRDRGESRFTRAGGGHAVPRGSSQGGGRSGGGRGRPSHGHGGGRSRR